MLFETGGDKSSVQLAVEAVLAAPVARTDMEGRKQRTRAAMVAEIADIGYANTKIATVAKRAQVSTATIYRDFGDRDGLIMSALEWVIGIFASHWVSDVAETDPIKRIEALLLAHGKALSDPFMGWIFRLYVHIANTVAPQLFALARASRDANLAIWLAEIARLERDGHVVKTDHQITVAIILGAIERRSILARMAFGENDGHKPTIPDIARHMAQALFQVFGTKAFWAARGGDVPTSWGANGPVDHGLIGPARTCCWNCRPLAFAHMPIVFWPVM
jgi:AcrR family transcriptional regulator